MNNATPLSKCGSGPKVETSNGEGDKLSLTQKEWLALQYLRLHQLAYAMVAFPIGAVIFIIPLFFNEELDMPITTIGWILAEGELLGIICMKWIEASRTGFLLTRPHDLHLVLAMIYILLPLIPMFSDTTSCLSGTMAICIQALNASSKPILGDAMHRLSVLLNKYPSEVFAQSNLYRWIGNAIAGATSPLLYTYILHSAFFYISIPLIVLEVVLIYMHYRIKNSYKSTNTFEYTNNDLEQAKDTGLMETFDHILVGMKGKLEKQVDTLPKSEHPRILFPIQDEILSGKTLKIADRRMLMISIRRLGLGLSVVSENSRVCSKVVAQHDVNSDGLCYDSNGDTLASQQIPSMSMGRLSVGSDISFQGRPSIADRHIQMMSMGGLSIGSDISLQERPSIADRHMQMMSMVRLSVGSDIYHQERPSIADRHMQTMSMSGLSVDSDISPQERPSIADQRRQMMSMGGLSVGSDISPQERPSIADRHIQMMSMDELSVGSDISPQEIPIISQFMSIMSMSELSVGSDISAEYEVDSDKYSVPLNSDTAPDTVDNDESESLEDEINDQLCSNRMATEEGQEAKENIKIGGHIDRETKTDALSQLHSTCTIVHNIYSTHLSDEKNKKCPMSIYPLLVTLGFPFWDAALTRLPFVFFTIALFSRSSVALLSLVLFGYQTCRGLSQVYQTHHCDGTTNHFLTALSICSYTLLIVYINTFPDGKLWYIFIIISGVAETMSIQQYYLARTFHYEEQFEDIIQYAVKLKPTAAGIGSMTAFILASQIYAVFDLKGVGYLGLGVSVCKELNSILIDVSIQKVKSKKDMERRLSIVRDNSLTLN